MNQTDATQPEPFRPVLELIGRMPDEGEYFCATCTQRYLGAVSSDPEIVAEVRGLIANAAKVRKSPVYFHLPELKNYVIRHAVTIAPSVYLAYPAPVCWVHMIPLVPQNNAEAGEAIRSPIIPGKSNNWKGLLS